MSASAAELPYVTFASFLAGEQNGEWRHEYVGGRVYVMAGGSERHDLAAGLLYRQLADQAEDQGCRAFVSNRLLYTAHAAYYPDVFITCQPAAHAHYENDACLIIEVLSPSTKSVDRREKAAAYAVLDSLRWYIIVDLEERSLEVASHGDEGLMWRTYGAGHVLVTPFGAIDVNTLFERLDRVATT